MAHLRSPKKTPIKFVDVCRICGETFPLVQNKQNLLLGHDSSVRLDYTLALEDITGQVTPGDGLPKAVCGSCPTLSRCYGRSKADVERIVAFVSEKASTMLKVKRCAPTSPIQQLKRVPVPPEETRSSSPSTQSLFQSDKPEGTEPNDSDGLVPLDDMATSSINAQ